jgi:hypothetical protein
VELVVAARQNTADVIALDTASPAAAGKDITVVEPAMAGAERISLLEIGLVDAAGGGCNLGTAPVTLTRPPGGTQQFTLCVFGTGLDQVTQATFSQPALPDLAVLAVDSSLGSLLLELTVLVPAGATPGMRTLFVDTVDLDRASLTAAVEVK